MHNHHIFHYTKSTTALENILSKQTLRLSQFQYTNDPKESKDLYIDAFTGTIKNSSVMFFEKNVVPILKRIKLRCQPPKGSTNHK
jgi:hypothetical protein